MSVFLGRIKIPLNEVAAAGEQGVSIAVHLRPVISRLEYLLPHLEYVLSHFEHMPECLEHMSNRAIRRIE